MKSLNEFLYSDQTQMRTFNATYVYFIHLIQSLLNITPPFIRNFGYRLMLHRMGKYTFFDYDVYIKFPWLVVIGSSTSINRGVQFYPGYKEKSRITLGDHVFVAPNVCFYAGGHDVKDFSQITGSNITVGDNVWIGANAIILPGVNIGSNCIIGAGSVVNRDIPENSLAAGNPARVLKYRKTA